MGSGAAEAGKLRRLVRWLATKAGWRTSYHVAATYPLSDHLGYGTMSLTVAVRPWIHRDNYRSLVEYLREQASGCKGTPNITSITKLGL